MPPRRPIHHDWRMRSPVVVPGGHGASAALPAAAAARGAGAAPHLASERRAASARIACGLLERGVRDESRERSGSFAPFRHRFAHRARATEAVDAHAGRDGRRGARPNGERGGDLGACGDGRCGAGGAEHSLHRALAATSWRRALRAAFPCGLGDPLAPVRSTWTSNDAPAAEVA